MTRDELRSVLDNYGGPIRLVIFDGINDERNKTKVLRAYETQPRFPDENIEPIHLCFHHKPCLVYERTFEGKPVIWEDGLTSKELWETMKRSTEDD